MARTGCSKEDIRRYISVNFGYDLNRNCNDIRPNYSFDGSCQGTVPESIIAFLDSKNYEDALRQCISLGGDADTMGAITGAIAGAYYGIENIPPEWVEAVSKWENFEIPLRGYVLQKLIK